MGRDSIVGTLLVAVVLCVVCSVLVSTAAVTLRPRQKANAALDQKKNILIAAGLVEDDATREQIDRVFEERVEQVLIDFGTDEVVPESDQPYAEYDPREAASTLELSEVIDVSGPTPGLDRREKMAFIYHVMAEGSETEVEQYVLPIYGRGLWSTLYGFLAVDDDGVTIRGITFYDHGETPGLGGEVENPNWQRQWLEKAAYDKDGNVAITVIKGTVDVTDPSAKYRVDGLSGATITTRGVSNFVQYWLGPDGFGPYLQKQTGNSPDPPTEGA